MTRRRYGELIDKAKALWTVNTINNFILFVGLAFMGFFGVYTGSAEAVFITLLCIAVLIELIQWVFVYRKDGTTLKERKSMMWDVGTRGFAIIIGLIGLMFFLPVVLVLKYIILAVIFLYLILTVIRYIQSKIA